MGLLDLVEQQHRVRRAPDGVGQQPALIEADVARRRADQPRDGVLLHVLAHVEAQELDAERRRQLLRELGLADAGRAGEQERADRLVGRAEAGAREPDGRDDRGRPRASWPKTSSLRSRSSVSRRSRSDVDTWRGGIRAIVATTRSMSSASMVAASGRPGFTCAAAPASSMTSIALSGRKRSWTCFADSSAAAAQRVVGVGDAVVLLVLALQPAQDLDASPRRSARSARSSGSGGRARDRARSAA